MILAVADTGPLYAVIDRSDRHHSACVEVFRTEGLRLLIPALVVTEVCQLLEHRIGPAAEAAFLSSLEDEDVRVPTPAEWVRIGQLVNGYADFPLGGVDASLIALAEALQIVTLVTLDRRHFSAVRPKHAPAFQLMP